MGHARAMAMVVMVGVALAPFGCVSVIGDFDVAPIDSGLRDGTTDTSLPDVHGDTAVLDAPIDAVDGDDGDDALDAADAADAFDAADALDAADAAPCPDAAPFLMCGTQCIDTSSDNNNCGDCGVVCKDARTCQSSKCQCAPLQECNGSCVDETKDPTNCGSCGFTCATNGSCSSSRCTCPQALSMACPPPPDPASTCIDPNTDNLNCGGCNSPCKSGNTCVAGTCQCVAPKTSCSGNCVDLKTDPLNCGACGHSCLGATCTGGLCTPTALTNALSGNPVGLIVDPNNVTWTQTNSTSSALMRCPISGCGGTVLTMVGNMPDTTTLATNGSRIFFANNGGGGSNTVERVNADGTSPTVWVASGNGESVAIDNGGNGNVYWTHNSTLSRADATIAGSPVATQIITVFTGFQPIGLAKASHQQIAFDATNVYVLDPGTGSADGRVLACAKTTSCGSAPSVLTSSLITPRGIAVVGGTIYMTSSALSAAGGVYTCASTSCGSTLKQIAATPGAQGLWADATTVYWGTVNGTAGGVFACPIAGCPAGGPNVIATAQQVVAVTTDASYVYYAAVSGASIWRVAK